ncbi:hypothetical protein [Mycoplasmopsis felifaucium]|uniref:RDD domain-containing protein n=1 Tax=Mycoplasmopsis felifaucium TaxID=35768 RepID=A0ABZ2RPD8_9BACT
MAHKNVSFWIRCVYGLLDVISFTSLLYVSFYFLIESPFKIHKAISAINYYLFWSFSIGFSFILYLLIPLFWDGRTLWMIICRVQVLFNNPIKQDNLSKFKLIFYRSILTFGVWLFIASLYLCLIYPKDFNNFVIFLNSNNKEAFSLRFNIVFGLVSSFIGLLVAFRIVDLAFMILTKRKIGLIDLGTNSRITYIKHYKTDLKDKIVLIPFKIQNQTYLIKD